MTKKKALISAQKKEGRAVQSLVLVNPTKALRNLYSVLCILGAAGTALAKACAIILYLNWSAAATMPCGEQEMESEPHPGPGGAMCPG